jgi:hypothetical protein
LLVLDFDILSSFGQTIKPAWDGHWTGLRTQQLIEGSFQGVHRAYSLGLALTDDLFTGRPNFVM